MHINYCVYLVQISTIYLSKDWIEQGLNLLKEAKDII